MLLFNLDVGGIFRSLCQNKIALESLLVFWPVYILGLLMLWETRPLLSLFCVFLRWLGFSHVFSPLFRCMMHGIRVIFLFMKSNVFKIIWIDWFLLSWLYFILLLFRVLKTRLSHNSWCCQWAEFWSCLFLIKVWPLVFLFQWIIFCENLFS